MKQGTCSTESAADKSRNLPASQVLVLVVVATASCVRVDRCEMQMPSSLHTVIPLKQEPCTCRRFVSRFPPYLKISSLLRLHWCHTTCPTTFFHSSSPSLFFNILSLQCFTGTRVERDAVECPSQMLEAWCFSAEPLRMVCSRC
jgi:hypothetical protein